MAQTSLLHYEAAWPVYCVDWCKTAPSSQPLRARSAFRLAISSFTEDYRNRIAIVGLQDERVLVEDDYDYAEYPDMVTLCEANHGYPATALQWQPASAASYMWSNKVQEKELLATTGDALRVWEYSNEGSSGGSGYVGRQGATTGHRLTLKTALSGQSKIQSSSAGAPLTNFSWNEKSPNLVVTSSIDTTCTVWNIETSAAVTQLIAHDREVYDVAWLPGSTDIFVSVGADGSLRAFDLRSLEHSTILYETPPPAKTASSNPSPRSTASPLIRIAFNPSDSNYMATFHMDGTDTQILDMRSPGQPVMELRAHRAQVNTLGWGSTESPMLATAGDDCQLLLWDLSSHMQPSSRNNNSNGNNSSSNTRLNSPRPDSKKRTVSEPVMAYTAPVEITSLAWSPHIPGIPMHTGQSTAPGEWIAIAVGKSVKALKV